ncbi:MAG: histidine kinase [Eubacterium sp.]|nr:histidine kinase [Eubacterium sp.]
MIRKLAHIYKYQLSLRVKMLITHLILTLIPALLITIFAYNQMVSVTTNTTLHSLNTLADQTRTNIGSTINQLDSMADGICDNEFFSSYVYTSHPAQYENIYDLSNGLATLENILITCQNNPLVSNIRVYMDDAHIDVLRKYTSNPIFETLAPAQGTYWHGILSSTNSHALLCPPMYLSPTELKTLGTHAVIRRIRGMQTECYVVLYFNQSVIQPILLQDLPYNNSVIYITNSRNEIVASTNTMLSGTYYIPYDEITTRIPSTTRQTKLQFAGENVFCGCKIIPNTDWIMVSAVPESNLTSDGNQLVLQFLALYALVLIICVIICQALSASVTGRISEVADKMEQVRYSSLPQPLEVPQGSDEVCSLIDSYNYMTNEIQRLITEQQRTANELRHSEFHALQAQINPHFLYNTLDMINWMAKSGETQHISEAVNLLSRFYRITLSKGSSFITVREEIEHVTLYVQLQNMRFNDKLHFYVDVPDEMLDYRIPKLVFQPIVENSILHGILEKPIKEGNIVIMGWMEDETLVFVISDDGVGISPEKLRTILSGTGSSQHGSNIAISNTHKRIRLCYGDQYGLSYRSTPGCETEVEIRIPASSEQSSAMPLMLEHDSN